MINNVFNIFGIESYLFAPNNVTGIANILLDVHMLRAYQKFNARVLGLEGRWEVKGDNKIKLFPVPKSSFLVAVEYVPPVYQFRTPWAKELTRRFMAAEAMIILGNIRSKRALITPDGGSTTMNGEALITKGFEEREKCVKDAINMGEPPGIYAL